MVIYGIAYDGEAIAEAGDWICIYGPDGENDCRGAGRVGLDGSFYIHITGSFDGELLSFRLFSYIDQEFRYTTQNIVFQINGSAVMYLNFGDSPVPGDINGDGLVTIVDYELAVKLASGIEPDQTVSKAGDVNGDEKIGLEEMSYILQKITGVRN